MCPDLDRSCDYELQNRKLGDETFKKSKTNGSISNLMERTPAYEPKVMKFSGRITMGSDIFTPTEHISKPKLRIPVNIEEIKKSKDYAGSKPEKDEDSKKVQ
jgi:hypothetical protein